MKGSGVLTWKNNGWERVSTSPNRKLAIVGSHPATREFAPYKNNEYEIWLFNESPQKPEVYRRWDASFQMHQPEVYSSDENWVNKDHWKWLQQNHGPGKRIWMIERDERVPNSVRYPLEEVLKLVPYRYLRSTPAMALALAIHLGYEDIALYGSELTSGTEYHYQAINYAFWIGFAHGRGINLDLQCWHSEFWQPIYGYEGELQISKSYYEGRITELGTPARLNKQAMERVQRRLDEAMLKNDYEKVGALSLNLEELAKKAGEAEGALREAERYLARTNQISRQEYERVSAQAQIDGDKLKGDMHHSGGKCEYVWNVWMQTGQVAALNQLRAFLKEKTDQAFEMGKKLGIMRENFQYIHEYDDRITAAGGQRAKYQVESVSQ